MRGSNSHRNTLVMEQNGTSYKTNKFLHYRCQCWLMRQFSIDNLYNYVGVVIGVAVSCCSVFYIFLIYGNITLRVPRCPVKRGMMYYNRVWQV